MGAPNNDEIKGKYEQAKGSIKEGMGRLTGDEQMRAEGSADKMKGDVQEGFGTAKRKVGEAIEDVGDAVKH
ncbi:MAG: CsbD family protein [Pyrinomonadaceae bacterium]